MKTLYLIGGPMGVGKTAAAQYLKQHLDRSVLLDGDWCWDMHPFVVNDETKALVNDNICHMLGNFLRCSTFEHVIFCWVMHEDAIIEGILARLPLDGVTVKRISLLCNEDTLRTRLKGDIDRNVRTKDVIDRSLARLPLYQALSTRKIDTTHLTIAQTAREILS